jgi:hypothetical protein
VNHRSTISRGDLLRCISQCPAAEETAARLCGFVAAHEPVQQERPDTGVGERPAVPRGAVAEPAAIRPAPGDFDNLTLWVPWRYQSGEETAPLVPWSQLTVSTPGAGLPPPGTSPGLAPVDPATRAAAARAEDPAHSAAHLVA